MGVLGAYKMGVTILPMKAWAVRGTYMFTSCCLFLLTNSRDLPTADFGSSALPVENDFLHAPATRLYNTLLANMATAIDPSKETSDLPSRSRYANKSTILI